jgi:hypothetical protein
MCQGTQETTGRGQIDLETKEKLSKTCRPPDRDVDREIDIKPGQISLLTIASSY